jgi:hypothetical protein
MSMRRHQACALAPVPTFLPFAVLSPVCSPAAMLTPAPDCTAVLLAMVQPLKVTLVPVFRGLHSSTYRLNVSTFCWPRWVHEFPPVYWGGVTKTA